MSPPDIMWWSYLCHCREINLPLNLQNLVLTEYCTKETHEIVFTEVSNLCSKAHFHKSLQNKQNVMQVVESNVNQPQRLCSLEVCVLL